MILRKDEFDFLTERNKQAIERHRKEKRKSEARGSVSVAEIRDFKELKREMKQIVWDETPDSVIKTVFDLINSFEAGQQKPRERGKQALEFLKWLMREIEAEYPYLGGTLKDLGTVKRIVEAFVNLEDDKKILEGEGGEKKG